MEHEITSTEIEELTSQIGHFCCIVDKWCTGSEEKEQIEKHIKPSHRTPSVKLKRLQKSKIKSLTNWSREARPKSIPKNQKRESCIVCEQPFEEIHYLKFVSFCDDRIKASFPKETWIDLEDIVSLRPDGWVSNKLLDCYLSYIIATKISANIRDKIMLMNALIYPTIIGTLPSDKIKNCTEQYEQMFNYDYVVFPVGTGRCDQINEMDHWILAVVCNPASLKPSNKSKNYFDRCHIVLMDSMIGHLGDWTRRWILKQIAEFLITWCKKVVGKEYEINMDDSFVLHIPEVPQQKRTSVGCGIFVTFFLESFFSQPLAVLLQTKGKWFSCKRIKNFEFNLRQRIYSTILNLVEDNEYHDPTEQLPRKCYQLLDKMKTIEDQPGIKLRYVFVPFK